MIKKNGCTISVPKWQKMIVWIVVLFSLMFAEYRFIMSNIHPHIRDDSTVYLQIDEYTVE